MMTIESLFMFFGSSEPSAGGYNTSSSVSLDTSMDAPSLATVLGTPLSLAASSSLSLSGILPAGRSASTSFPHGNRSITDTSPAMWSA
jgi:hypothetical protein